MQSTGHSSTHARSLRSTQGWAMTYVTVVLLHSSRSFATDLVSRFPTSHTKAPHPVDGQLSPLDAARPGERWVIRTRLPDGSATDLIGWLDELGPTTVSVSADERTRVSIERARVIAARRAPAAPGGPDPLRVSAEDL